jgi:hypothetical protein
MRHLFYGLFGFFISFSIQLLVAPEPGLAALIAFNFGVGVVVGSHIESRNG